MHASGNICIPGQEDLNLEPQPRPAPEEAIVFLNNAGLLDVVYLIVAG